MTPYSFSQATQFTLDSGSITLKHGESYIAQGSFSDWIHCFEACSQRSLTERSTEISESITLEGRESHAWLIYDGSKAEHCIVKIVWEHLHTLETRLEELHQGCCEPNPYNPVAEICERPDEVLQMLQEVTQYSLSSEQSIIAKESLKSWPSELEITVGDLSKMWSKNPQLKFFAKTLRFYFWS